MDVNLQKNGAKKNSNIALSVTEWVENWKKTSFELEYFQIADETTLLP
jgi:hypothetical protein